MSSTGNASSNDVTSTTGSGTSTTWEYDFEVNELPEELLAQLQKEHPDAQFQILEEVPEEDEDDEDEEEDEEEEEEDEKPSTEDQKAIVVASPTITELEELRAKIRTGKKQSCCCCCCCCCFLLVEVVFLVDVYFG